MQYRRMIDSLFAFFSRHEAIRAGHATRIGLTGIEYTFLVSVLHYQEESGVSVKSLADRLHLSGTFCTTMTGKLIKKGLMSKKVDEADRRKVCLEVTEKGYQLLSELAPVQRKVNDIAFGCLSRADFLTLCNLLGKLIESSDQALALQTYLAANEQKSP